MPSKVRRLPLPQDKRRMRTSRGRNMLLARPKRRLAIATTVATILVLLSGGAPAWAEQAQDYEIKLVRPLKVGQKYTMTAEGALVRSSTLKVAGQAAGRHDEGYGVVLEGTVEVLAVNAD